MNGSRMLLLLDYLNPRSRNFALVFVGFKFSPPNKIVLDDGYAHDDPGPWTVVGENLVDSKGNTLDREGVIIDAKKRSVSNGFSLSLHLQIGIFKYALSEFKNSHLRADVEAHLMKVSKGAIDIEVASAS